MYLYETIEDVERDKSTLAINLLPSIVLTPHLCDKRCVNKGS